MAFCLRKSECVDLGYVSLAFLSLNVFSPETENIECPICKTGEYQAGKVTVKLESGDSIILIKEVPAQVWDNCGEYILDEQVTKKVLEKAEQAVANNADVKVLKFAAWRVLPKT